MMKLLTLCSLVVILGALIAAPKPATAQGSCPLPGGSASTYCADYACSNPYGSQGSGYGSACYNYCVASVCADDPECC